jgi:NADP-dependent 3-hydroxy acid dehydrogenase YdfG
MRTEVNKFAVVNGGYGAMGYAIARRLAEAGYSLVLLGRDLKKLELIKIKLKDVVLDDCLIVSYEVDVKNNESMKKAALSVIENNYHIDTLINAVGVVPVGNIQDVSEDLWENAIQTSLMSAVRLISNFYLQ